MNSAEEAGPPAPTVMSENLEKIAEDVNVIRDGRIPLVPNVGIVEGREAVLVVDCGMGPKNGQTVLDVARRIAGDRRVILTITHFHPEHGYGAQVFKGKAEIFYNAAQREDLSQKGEAYLAMFKTFGPAVAEALEGTEIVMPDAVYDGGSTTIDLGGRTVRLATFGLAHTRGDQIVWLPEEKILFTGDLAEERMFPIFPWFPPEDADLDAIRWAEVLAELEALDPAIVVPGHGDIGDKAILSSVRGYLLDLKERVAAERRTGKDGDAIVDALSSRVRAEHPDWDGPEWIDFAIRYYATLV